MPDHAHQLLLILIGADALGAGAEFCDAAEAQRLQPDLELRGGGTFNWKPGEGTDDSQTILAGLWTWQDLELNESSPSRNIGLVLQRHHQGLNDWLMSSPPDVGISTQQALRSGPQAWSSRRNEAGNGALMRLPALTLHCLSSGLPIGANDTIGGLPLSVAEAAQGACTHLDPRSLISCAWSGGVARELLRASGRSQKDLERACRAGYEAVREVRRHQADLERALMTTFGLQARHLPGSTEWRSAWNSVEFAIEQGFSAPGKGSGYVIDSLQGSVWALSQWMTTDASGWDLILQLVQRGQDSDTSAITAAWLLGSAGALTLPERWSALGLGHSWRSGERRWDRSWRGTDALRAAAWRDHA